MPKLTVRVYADELLLRETADECVAAAIMSFIANPLPNKHLETIAKVEAAMKAESIETPSDKYEYFAWLKSNHNSLSIPPKHADDCHIYSDGKEIKCTCNLSIQK